MTRTLSVTEAKARLLALLDEVSAGEDVLITRHGRPIARLVPAAGPRALKARFAGVAASNAEDADLFSTGLSWSIE